MASAPFQVTGRSCYVVYLNDGEPVEIRGTPREVKLEARRRMAEQQEQQKAMASTRPSLAKKLVNKAVPTLRKSSIVPETEEPSLSPSRINLLDLPTEILEQIVSEIGVKNFYDAPERALVCWTYQKIVRKWMERRVELDINSLLRFVPAVRKPIMQKLLSRRRRRKTTDSSQAQRDDAADGRSASMDTTDLSQTNATSTPSPAPSAFQKTLLRPARVLNFTADLRVINGFKTLNNVPVERNTDYSRWKANADRSLEWLAKHAHELEVVRSVKLRAWTTDCLIAERHSRQWSRLCREMVADLAIGAQGLDRLELDLCGRGFTWMRCGWPESTSACDAIRALLPRLRVLWLRVQSICPRALDLAYAKRNEVTGRGHVHGGGALSESDDDDDDDDNHEEELERDKNSGYGYHLQAESSTHPTRKPKKKTLRLQELIINKDTWEANPWGASGPQAGTCLLPPPLLPDLQEPIPAAMRKVLRKMREPRLVRFIWNDNKYEQDRDPNVKVPLNSKGQPAYRGSVAYDVFPEHRVSRLGFLEPWDSGGVVLHGCEENLWPGVGESKRGGARVRSWGIAP